jgi:formate hydrogenlyase subunit 3/multisubunit Na+/H+ antiporter MnhD subunit
MTTALFRTDPLSYFIGGAVIFFTFMTLIYSAGFMRGKKNLARYYFYIFFTALTSLAAVFASHLIVFIVFWGFLSVLLFLLIQFGDRPRTAATAQKALIIIAGTDAFMILGIALIWLLTGSFDMGRMRIPLDNNYAFSAFLLLLVGTLAKAGGMPFHTWVPDTAEDAPTPVTAFLPASLDKLLGIYFLARITQDIFQLNNSAQTLLLAIGSVTIICAVMMAIVQHDLKRLLGYHAVSQVGYMILGFGSGNPIGVAGGLFHMLNNAIYKPCLFFCAGAVEKKTGTTDLERLGGLIKTMPLTFLAFLIASLSIAGIPPFNGFTSKWLIYESLIETGRSGGHLWVVWVLSAMFGCALTLASFMKLVHAVFLGQPSVQTEGVTKPKQETPVTMLFPIVLLAMLCILFGIFTYVWPLQQYILPSVKGAVHLPGTWNPVLASELILLGLGIGVLVYLLGIKGRTRRTESFIGGEDLKANPEMRLSGNEFYHTIKDYFILKDVYRLAKEKFFDVYEQGAKLGSVFSRVLKYCHNGILPTYLAWCLLGMIVFFCVFMK